MASVHSGFTRDVERMTKRVIRALETERIDVLCHPTGRLIGRREAYGLDIEAVIEAAAKTNTALELNCSPERLDLKDTHCHMAKEAGVKVCLGTDAHSTGMLDHILFGVLTARRGWLERSDVVNAMSVGEFRKWLQRRR
jgi:DNA polymerase (family 10)